MPIEYEVRVALEPVWDDVLKRKIQASDGNRMPVTHPIAYTSGSQTFSGNRPLGSINSYPVPPPLNYKKHSSEQRFAQPTKEDNNNKIRYHT
jgi:hypothetical protein